MELEASDYLGVDPLKVRVMFSWIMVLRLDGQEDSVGVGYCEVRVAALLVWVCLVPDEGPMASFVVDCECFSYAYVRGNLSCGLAKLHGTRLHETPYALL